MRDMMVLAGTDFHGYKPAFEALAVGARREKADLIVICGDITNFGTKEQAETLLRMLAEAGIPVLFVPGNCDPPSLTEINLKGVTCIHGSGAVLGGLVFLGVGGSPITPFNTFFEMSENEMAKILDRCLNNIGEVHRRSIVLVSHSPPKNTRTDRTFMGIHVGSSSIRSFIEKHKPLLTICGHIHEAKGKDLIDSSLIVNPGPARQGNYAIIHINKDGLNVEFKTIKL